MLRKISIILLCIFFFCIQTYAHPWRTASDWCHYCRTNCSSRWVPRNQRHCHNWWTTTKTYSSTTKKVNTTPKCASNATYNYYNKVCECNSWYTYSLNKTYCIKIPENAHATTSSSLYAWECNSWYTFSVDKTYCVKIPENAHAITDSSTDVWECNNWYTSSLDKTYCVKIPEDAHAITDSSTDVWKCNNWYTSSLDKTHCVEIPDNAHAITNSSTSVWECNEWYEQNNKECILIPKEPIEEEVSITKDENSDIGNNDVKEVEEDNRETLVNKTENENNQDKDESSSFPLFSTIALGALGYNFFRIRKLSKEEKKKQTEKINQFIKKVINVIRIVVWVFFMLTWVVVLLSDSSGIWIFMWWMFAFIWYFTYPDLTNKIKNFIARNK